VLPNLQKNYLFKSHPENRREIDMTEEQTGDIEHEWAIK
jgi:hypothetical protein